MKLNPGVNHIMHEDDICYYIGFTKEEYSKVREREAPAVRNALCQVCAGAAVMVMSTSGVDPLLLDDKYENVLFPGKLARKDSLDEKPSSPLDQKLLSEYTTLEDKLACPLSSRSSAPALLHLPSHDRYRHPSPLSRQISHAESIGGESSSNDPHHEARRGLQLLRFHSRVDVHSKPVVKVNLKHEAEPPTTSPSELSALAEEREEEEEEEEAAAQITQFTIGSSILHTSEDNVNTRETETAIDLSDRGQTTLEKIGIQKSFSHPDKLHDADKATPGPVRRGAMLYSSELSLLNPSVRLATSPRTPGEHVATHHKFVWPSVLQRASIWSTGGANHSNSSVTIQQPPTTEWGDKDEVGGSVTTACLHYEK